MIGWLVDHPEAYEEGWTSNLNPTVPWLVSVRKLAKMVGALAVPSAWEGCCRALVHDSDVPPSHHRSTGASACSSLVSERTLE